jgi:hypothetical protein
MSIIASTFTVTNLSPTARLMYLLISKYIN